MTFDEWLRTVCFQKPTNEAYDLAKTTWDAATAVERDRCAKICEKMMTETDQPYDDNQDTHIDGWIAACNECKWAINEGTKP